MTTTIFLHNAFTLRLSFPYSAATVAAIKTVEDAAWDAASKTWRVPLVRLDALLRVFGDDCAVAPEAAMAAAPTLPIEHFAQTCASAGVNLRIEGDRAQGSGGCWTPLLQAEIDRRAVPLRRLLQGGWQPPRPLAPPPPAPVPASYDHITHLDRVMAAGEVNWLAKEMQKQDIIDNAKRRKRKEMFRKFDAQLGIEGLLP